MCGRMLPGSGVYAGENGVPLRIWRGWRESAAGGRQWPPGALRGFGRDASLRGGLRRIDAVCWVSRLDAGVTQPPHPPISRGTPAASGRAARAATRADQEKARDAAGRNRWWRRLLRVVRRRLAHGLVWLLAAPVVWVWAKSWRVTRVHGQRFQEAIETGSVLWLWHGDLAALLPLHSHNGVQVLVSPSGDGAVVATVLKRFGYRVTWGSSHRAASRALKELVHLLFQGQSVAITPDGPRGPRHSVNLGPAWLAREAGVPLLGIVVAADRAKRARSWDRLLLPSWRARLVVSYVGPFSVAKGADEAELERVTAEVAAAMGQAEADADASVGG